MIKEKILEERTGPRTIKNPARRPGQGIGWRLRSEPRGTIEVVVVVLVERRFTLPVLTDALSRLREAGGDDFVLWVRSLEQEEDIGPLPLSRDFVGDCVTVVLRHVAYDYLVDDVDDFGLFDSLVDGDAVD